MTKRSAEDGYVLPDVSQRTLRALGYDPTGMPLLTSCTCPAPPEALALNHDIIGDWWGVHCANCGLGADWHTQPGDAVIAWNQIIARKRADTR